jgi:hypothetical protein
MRSPSACAPAAIAWPRWICPAQCAARLGVTPVDMDGAYNAMLSRPDELCHALEHVERV